MRDIWREFKSLTRADQVAVYEKFCAPQNWDDRLLRQAIDWVTAEREPKRYIVELRAPKKGERYHAFDLGILTAGVDHHPQQPRPVIVGEQ